MLFLPLLRLRHVPSFIRLTRKREFPLSVRLAISIPFFKLHACSQYSFTCHKGYVTRCRSTTVFFRTRIYCLHEKAQGTSPVSSSKIKGRLPLLLDRFRRRPRPRCCALCGGAYSLSWLTRDGKEEQNKRMRVQ